MLILPIKKKWFDMIVSGEKTEEYIAAALAPAEVLSVTMVSERACRVQVAPDQLSLAIGKKGQNAMLAARLTGIKIDINAEGLEKSTVITE